MRIKSANTLPLPGASVILSLPCPTLTNTCPLFSEPIWQSASSSCSKGISVMIGLSDLITGRYTLPSSRTWGLESFGKLSSCSARCFISAMYLGCRCTSPTLLGSSCFPERYPPTYRFPSRKSKMSSLLPSKMFAKYTWSQ